MPTGRPACLFMTRSGPVATAVPPRHCFPRLHRHPSAAQRGRVAALVYRQSRREGMGNQAAMASLRKQWPELSAKVASAEVVAAIAYASSHHRTWLWDGVVP